MLTTRMQIQALANRLAGIPNPAPLLSTQFSEPFLACWLALEEAHPDDLQATLVNILQTAPDGDRLILAILTARPGFVPSYPSLAELEPTLKPIEWVWRNWIPRGMITLLGAVSGAGKSFLALDLARRILHNQPFPDGASFQPSLSAGAAGAPRSIIYVDAEAVPQLINERAKRWNMDTSRLFLMLPDGARDDGMLDFSQQPSRDSLIEMATILRPEMIIIDSLSSISSKGENNIEDVRAIFSFLNHLAQDLNTGLLLIHHFRKGLSMQPRLSDVSVDDVRGSGHIIAIARSVMGLSIVQTEQTTNRNGPRKLEILKTNLGPYPAPLGFEYAPLHPEGVTLRWTSTPEPFREPTQLDACKNWLEDQLRAAPKRPSDLESAAAAAGHSRATLYRARETLGARIQNTHGRRHPQNLWQWVDPPAGNRDGEGGPGDAPPGDGPGESQSKSQESQEYRGS